MSIVPRPRRRKPGPPKGSPRRGGEPKGGTGLIKGEVEFIETFRDLSARVGLEHPIVQEMLRVHYHIARGDRGYGGRYVGQRLQAATHLLKQLVGEPRGREPQQQRVDPPVIITVAADEVGLRDAEDEDQD